MSFRSIHLRKILKIMYLPENLQIRAIRGDIRETIARDAGAIVAGGDFYGPFWHDAKSHAAGSADLRLATTSRVESNPIRENLYPQLQAGFLLWWNERRRWTNQPFEMVTSPSGRYRFPHLNATIKVDNFLAMRDRSDLLYYTYPYFFPEPVLSEEAARLGLWLIGRALPGISWTELRILDVIRGNTFDVERYPLLGNEEESFVRRHGTLLDIWETLRQDY